MLNNIMSPNAIMLMSSRMGLSEMFRDIKLVLYISGLMCPLKQLGARPL